MKLRLMDSFKTIYEYNDKDLIETFLNCLNMMF